MSIYHDCQHKNQQYDERPCQYTVPPLTFLDGIRQIGYVLVSTFQWQLAPSCNSAPFQIHQTEDDSKAIDIVAHISHSRLHLLWRHVFERACGLFQNGMAVCVCQPEVYQFHIVAITRDDNILWFQVAMHDTLGMDIPYSLRHLHRHSSAFLAWMGSLQPLLQCFALHILHDDAVAHAADMFQSCSGNHRWMLQLHQQLQLFPEPLLICRFVGNLAVQPLQHPPSSIPLGPSHNVGFRCVQNLHIGKPLTDSLKGINDIAGSRTVIIVLHITKVLISVHNHKEISKRNKMEQYDSAQNH